MITYKEAYKDVLEKVSSFGEEKVLLLESVGRVLAENILADRDFPPFDRATKDGIALNYSAIERGQIRFRIEGVAQAGLSQQKLSKPENCLEVMTGAVVPEGTDTVIMYEHLQVNDGWASVVKYPEKGQDIHYKGSDKTKGAILLESGNRISAGFINALASVGKFEVLVKKLPKIAVISTGNELVEVSETPLPHQIRKSNSLALAACLAKEHIVPQMIHLRDDLELIENSLEGVLRQNDVVLLSGGVSKGKFDFIPAAFEKMGVQKIFHRVAQRPGKPFWFGVDLKNQTVIFSFPGNPVSTFANFHIYFLPWYYKSIGLEFHERKVILDEAMHNKSDLTLFIQVKTIWKQGSRYAKPIVENGSGDLTSLANSNGFVCLEPRKRIYEIGEVLSFIQTD